MIKLYRLHKLIIFTLLACWVFSFTTPLSVVARDAGDIQDDIDEKEAELEKINKELADAQKKLNSSTGKKNSAQGSLKQLEAEIQQLEDTMQYNKVKIQFLEESKKIKELEKEKREEKQDAQIMTSYLSWKAQDDKLFSMMFNSDDPVKTATYYDLMTSNGQKDIEALATELNEIKKDYDDFQKEYDQLQKDFAIISEQISQKKKEISTINATIAAEASKLSSTKQQANKTKSQIDQLYDEQKALQEYEAWLLGQAGNGGTKPIVDGEYFFTGRGRDAVQGHGVGLSQNGALGAALAGWSFKQILQFYYPGVQIIKYTSRTTLNVQGYGTMDIDKYSSGIGEVPSTGCEDLGVAFPSKGYWGCWPKEAIKAQIVAARTYALSYTSSGNTICTTASCQVYLGGEAKKKLVEETSYLIASVNGQPIKAVYSANNNQGAGTANNDTIWSNRLGVGTPYSYLRSVNDNAFYYPATYTGCAGDCSKWAYRTNSYTMEEIESMFRWISTTSNSSVSSSDKTFVSGILSGIGNLTSITFVKDPSGRVKKVVVTGDAGSKEMAGWFFKSIWNIWVGTVMPSGQKDYIYSLTFYLLKG